MCKAIFFPLGALLVTAALTFTIGVSAAGVAVPTASETAAQTSLLARSCTSCHGASRGSVIPALYGRKARRLEKYLLGYKTGNRKGTLMPRIARGYSDEQLALLANHFASSPVPGSKK